MTQDTVFTRTVSSNDSVAKLKKGDTYKTENRQLVSTGTSTSTTGKTVEYRFAKGSKVGLYIAGIKKNLDTDFLLKKGLKGKVLYTTDDKIVIEFN